MVGGGPETDDGFGSVIQLGDVNLDECTDLIIGVPSEDLGTTKDAVLVATEALAAKLADKPVQLDRERPENWPGYWPKQVDRTRLDTLLAQGTQSRAAWDETVRNPRITGRVAFTTMRARPDLSAGSCWRPTDPVMCSRSVPS